MKYMSFVFDVLKKEFLNFNILFCSSFFDEISHDLKDNQPASGPSDQN